ncbi:unnamed protein product [Calicophoron daubneyi]|uniref:Glycosyl transferase 64 domain-containing protein n=1 Tax=Calicophoron daubneyi TaxID=300641 RepID=A0AAV2TAU5_CALDB
MHVSSICINHIWRQKQQVVVAIVLVVFVYGILNYDSIATSTQKKRYVVVVRNVLGSFSAWGRRQSLRSSTKPFWSKEYCLNESQLRFCTLSKPTAVDPLLSISPQYPGGIRSCDVVDDFCLKIVYTVEDALECVQYGPVKSKTMCLAVFTQITTSQRFFDQIANKSGEQVSIPVAAVSFPNGMFRRSFDLLLPVDHVAIDGEIVTSVDQSISLLPARRHILLSFSAGRFRGGDQSEVALFEQLTQLSQEQTAGEQKEPNRISVNFFQNSSGWGVCWPNGNMNLSLFEYSGWYPCSNLPKLLINSTFSLVVETEVDANPLGWQTQLIECLKYGAIPVLIGAGPLPGDEAISQSQWDKAVIRAEGSSAQKLLNMLSSLPDEEIFEMRRQGQIIYHRYFIDQKARMSTLLLAVTRRFTYLPPMAPVVSANVVYFGKPSVGSPDLSEAAEIPVSRPYRRTYDDRVYPFWSYPSTPWDSFPPSDIIANQGNSSGWIYDRQLGYDFRKEQFTVIVLVYNRLQLAYETIKSLDRMKHLKSVIVVYNNPKGSLENVSWPRLHVPVYVVQSKRNSLNNRFLPYDLIKTDAIFSLDDDSRPSQRAILETFRLWRSNRERMVGFAARVHEPASDGWRYDTDASHHYSMILTGIAIFHRYYLYAYTYEMPAVIRDLVDKGMNCEDIAMNLLIAHLTRKPPLLTNEKPSFACNGCQSSLSVRGGHYKRRSQCLNSLKEVYGYMPLLYTTTKGLTL